MKNHYDEINNGNLVFRQVEVLLGVNLSRLGEEDDMIGNVSRKKRTTTRSTNNSERGVSEEDE